MIDWLAIRFPTTTCPWLLRGNQCRAVGKGGLKKTQIGRSFFFISCAGFPFPRTEAASNSLGQLVLGCKTFRPDFTSCLPHTANSPVSSSGARQGKSSARSKPGTFLVPMEKHISRMNLHEGLILQYRCVYIHCEETRGTPSQLAGSNVGSARAPQGMLLCFRDLYLFHPTPFRAIVRVEATVLLTPIPRHRLQAKNLGSRFWRTSPAIHSM